MQMQIRKREPQGGEYLLSKLEEWAAPKLAPGAKPKVTEVGLCHHALLPDGNSSLDTIDRIKLTGKETVGQIVSQLFETAQASVDSSTHPQKYSIVLFETPEMPVGRREFLLTPPPSMMAGGETEPANVAGITAQMMRHYEAMSRLNIMSQQHCSTILETEIERLRAENGRLRETHFSMIQAREELLDRSAERNMRIRQEQAEVQRGERWVQRAEQLIGAVLENHLQLSGSSVPAPSTGVPTDKPTMLRLLGTLSEEQRSQLTDSLDKILNEDQGKMFYDALSAMKE